MDTLKYKIAGNRIYYYPIDIFELVEFDLEHPFRFVLFVV